MKRFVFLVTIFLCLSFVFALPAFAKIISSEGTVTISADEVIDDDLFVGAETVVIEGTVNGDVFAAGRSIKVSGVINGDIFAFGLTVEISGKVKDDIRVGAMQVSISGAEVGDGVAAGAGDLKIDKETKIGGGLIFGAATVDCSGEVGRGVLGGAGTVSFDGKIGKDVKVSAESIAVGSEAEIGGDFNYTSEKEATIDQAAKIFGETKHFFPEVEEKVKEVQGWRKIFRQLDLGFKIFSYFATLLVGFFILYFIKKPAEKASNLILEKPWKVLGTGFLTLVLTPIGGLLLLMTGIGFPLAMILLIFYILDLYLAKIFVGLLFGRSLFELIERKNFNVYTTFALGLLVYYVITALPYVGIFVSLAALLFGLGSIVLVKKEALIKPRN